MLAAALTLALLLVAFVLLLLVSLSVPIIKSIYLFRLFATASRILVSSASGDARFGVWGYCTSDVSLSVAGVDRSTAGICSEKHLGYTFDRTVARALGVSDVTDSISRALSAVLVLHPIACGLTFLALLCSIFIATRRAGASRVASLATLIVGLLAALLTTVVFLIDVIFVAVARNRLNDDFDGVVRLTWGNAVWMTLGAAIAIWASLVGACCGVCCGGRFGRKRDARY